MSGAGHLPASAVACKDGLRTPWQARRAPPEAVPVCKRRDPLLPLTGISGSAQGARQPETAPPGRHWENRASSCRLQSPRRSGDREGIAFCRLSEPPKEAETEK